MITRYVSSFGFVAEFRKLGNWIFGHRDFGDWLTFDFLIITAGSNGDNLFIYLFCLDLFAKGPKD